MNLDHDFVQVWKFSEDQKKSKWNPFFPKFRWRPKKKGSSSKIEHFFPNLRSDVHPFKLLGGMQMWTIIKLLGRYSQNIGGYIPPPPLVSAPLTTYPNLVNFGNFFNFWFKSFPLAKCRLHANLGPNFWSAILRYLCPIKNPCLSKIVDGVVACDLRFALLPKSKILPMFFLNFNRS